jgi:glycosyltransferase 2 family protein
MTITPPVPPQPRHRLVRRLALWLPGLLLLGGLIAVVLHLGELQRFGELVAQAHPLWLLAGCGLQAATYVCAGGVWYLALDRSGSHRPLAAMVPLSLAKLFTDQAVPLGGISGTILVVHALTRRGIPSRVAMAALLVGLVSYYGAYLAAVLAAIAVLAIQYTVNAAIIAAAAVFSLIAVGVPAFVLLVVRHAGTRLDKYVARIPGAKLLLNTIADAPADLLRDPALVGGTMLLQLAVFLLDAATLAVVLAAIGSDGTHLPGVFASFMIASVAATVGPTPLGLGTFESVCVATLVLVGVRLEAALAATLLLRGLTLWLPMLPGLWIARRELRQDHDAHSPISSRGTSAW